MTDNRATELQGILDEFEHECFMLRVEASETRAKDDAVRKSYERIRNEFAGRIDALVGDRESELQSALNKAAGNWAKADALLRERTSGTLTAEQVREAIERNFGKVAVLDDGKPVEWRDDWVCNVGINYKAIADELNTRAERTCKNDSIKRNCGVFVCSECRVYLDIADMTWDGEDDSGGFYEPRFCPNCGAEVVD